MRTIPIKEFRLPNGAHGAPCIAFTTPTRWHKQLDKKRISSGLMSMFDDTRR